MRRSMPRANRKKGEPELGTADRLWRIRKKILIVPEDQLLDFLEDAIAELRAETEALERSQPEAG
jgi:hypothetical protein